MDASNDDGIKIGQLIARCWSDGDFKARFMAEPKAVLAEYGVETPAGVEINVLENTESTRYFVIPPSPMDGSVSNSDLSQVYGANNWCA